MSVPTVEFSFDVTLSLSSISLNSTLLLMNISMFKGSRLSKIKKKEWKNQWVRQQQATTSKILKKSDSTVTLHYYFPLDNWQKDGG